MKDYNIHHGGKYGNMIIGNLKADTDRKALNLARKMYGDLVTVSLVVR